MLQGKTDLITAVFGLATVGMVLDTRHYYSRLNWILRRELNGESEHVKLSSLNRSFAGFGGDRQGPLWAEDQKHDRHSTDKLGSLSCQQLNFILSQTLISLEGKIEVKIISYHQSTNLIISHGFTAYLQACISII